MTCWIVWPTGHGERYRCIDAETAEEAVTRWVRKYGEAGAYEVMAVVYGAHDEMRRFEVNKRRSEKAA